jgi:hypothetical protein
MFKLGHAILERKETKKPISVNNGKNKSTWFLH